MKTKKKCEAKTKQGTRCKNWGVVSGRCRIHSNTVMPAAEEKSRTRRERIGLAFSGASLAVSAAPYIQEIVRFVITHLPTVVSGWMHFYRTMDDRNIRTNLGVAIADEEELRLMMSYVRSKEVLSKEQEEKMVSVFNAWYGNLPLDMRRAVQREFGGSLVSGLRKGRIPKSTGSH